MTEKHTNKKKWYKTWWGILGIIFLFPIILMGFLTRLIWKQTWKPKVKFALLAILWGPIVIGLLVSEVYDTTKPKTQEAVTVSSDTMQSTNAPAEQKIEEKQTPEQIFEGICRKYGGIANCIYDKDETGAWAVTQLIQPEEDFMLFTTAKQISRDFIFAVYATKLPIAHSSVTVNMPGKYYRAGLGADVAKTQPDSTWTSNDVGPTIFYDFLQSATNGSAGDGRNSTYVETNLN